MIERKKNKITINTQLWSFIGDKSFSLTYIALIIISLNSLNDIFVNN